MSTDEVWKPVVVEGFEDLYEVSSKGRVRRVRIIQGSCNADGYLMIDLSSSKRGSRKCRFAHRLVAEAFHGPPEPGQQVNHKNGQKDDNRPENLEYMTCGENIRHAYRELGCSATRSRGVDHYSAVLTEELVREARRRYSDGESYSGIAKRLGVTYHAIWDCVNRRSWCHIE